MVAASHQKKEMGELTVREAPLLGQVVRFAIDSSQPPAVDIAIFGSNVTNLAGGGHEPIYQDADKLAFLDKQSWRDKSMVEAVC